MKYFASTNVGKKRNKNEDYYYAGIVTVPKLEKQLGIYIIADGMGGYLGGDIASKLAVNTITEVINQNIDMICENIAFVIKKAARVANDKIKKLADTNKEYVNMGTTISLVIIIDDVAYHAEIGDSRIYHLKQNELQQVSKDDTFVEKLVEDGIITKEESVFHPQRHVLTKALGIYNDINIDVDSFKLRNGEKILLCSDGLTNMISDEELFNILSSNETEDVSNELINAANKKRWA